MTRRCYMCQREKPLEAFTRDNERPSGYGFRCKACDGTLSRDRRWKNRANPPRKILDSMIERQTIKCSVLEEKLRQERQKLAKLHEQRARKPFVDALRERLRAA